MAGHGQPPKGADKRTQCVNVRFSPAEIETIDKANAAEMPGKPRGAYVRYAALAHAATVDTSILELRAERWYYYHRDQYGREVCYKMDGVEARKAQLEPPRDDVADWQVQPMIIESGAITLRDAERRKMHALAALLRAEAAEEDK